MPGPDYPNAPPLSLNELPALLTGGQVATLSVVGVRTVRKWTSGRKLTLVRLSHKCVRYQKSDILALINATAGQEASCAS